MNAVILLYYREPHGNSTRLICACEDFHAVNKQIEKLTKEQPNIYSFSSRFETVVIELIKKESFNEL